MLYFILESWAFLKMSQFSITPIYLFTLKIYREIKKILDLLKNSTYKTLQQINFQIDSHLNF